MAPSARGRVVLLAMTIFIIYFLFFSGVTGPSTSEVEAEFRRRTEEGLAKKRNGVLQGQVSDEELTHKTNKKLQAIIDNHPHYGGSGTPKEEKVTDEKNVKYGKYDTSKGKHKPSTQDDHEGEDDEEVEGKRRVDKIKSEQSQKAMATEDDEDVSEPVTRKGKTRAKAGQDEKKKTSSDPAMDVVREKLQEYLRKPVVIFSKSYCPHSKRAKHLLTELYTIVPAPLIVELDQLSEKLPVSRRKTSGDDEDEDDDTTLAGDDVDVAHAPTLGVKLQELLGQLTNRRTVPNIMVGMESIGGNDVLWELHQEGKLAALIQKLGGKRITKAEVNSK